MIIAMIQSWPLAAVLITAMVLSFARWTACRDRKNG